MDWYYPVLAGVLDRRRRSRAAGRSRFDVFVMEGRGVRCVTDRPWVTVAETCECVLAHLAVGDRDTAEQLFAWAQQYRVDGGRYWTGTVYPDEAHFPATSSRPTPRRRSCSPPTGCRAPARRPHCSSTTTRSSRN